MTDAPVLVASQEPHSARSDHLASLRMRLQTSGDVPPLPAEEALWLLEEFNKLEDSLEAQAKEIERLHENVANWKKVANEKQAEIERLHEELDTHLKVHLGVVRDNTRLRAVIRNIGNGRVGDQIIADVSEYAKAQVKP